MYPLTTQSSRWSSSTTTLIVFSSPLVADLGGDSQRICKAHKPQSEKNGRNKNMHFRSKYKLDEHLLTGNFFIDKVVPHGVRSVDRFRSFHKHLTVCIVQPVGRHCAFIRSNEFASVKTVGGPYRCEPQFSYVL